MGLPFAPIINNNIKQSLPLILNDVSSTNPKASGQVERINLLPYPYLSKSGDYKGVNVQVQSDGSIVMNGINTTGKYGYFNLSNKNFSDQTLNKNNPTDGKVFLTTYNGDIVYDKNNHMTFIFIFPNREYKNFIYKPQVEKGINFTEWHPYIPDLTKTRVVVKGDGVADREYTPNAVGNILNMVLNPLNTTVLSDTSGLNIILNYNADTKQYILNKKNKLEAIKLEKGAI